MINIAVTGAAGRMGRALINACQQSESCQLSAAIEHSGNSLLGSDAGDIAGGGVRGIKLVDKISEVTDQFDILIDFSLNESTLHNLVTCITPKQT